MKGADLMEQKGCCISAVRTVGSPNISITLSGSRSSLVACFRLVVRSLLSAGVSPFALILAFDSEVDSAGVDDD